MLRFGCHNFLNAKPLTFALTNGILKHNFELISDTPANLSDMLKEGRLDIAVIPSIEYARIPGLKLIRDFSISSLGTVNTVLLFSKNEIMLLFKDRDFAGQVAVSSGDTYLPSLIVDRKNITKQLSIFEVHRYLESQLLVDSDKFSMSKGLELRVPLVDKVVAETLATINTRCFLNDKITKALLINATGDIPENIVVRSKQGFALPMGKMVTELDLEVFNEYFNTETIAFYASSMHWSRIWALQVLNKFMLEFNY